MNLTLTERYLAGYHDKNPGVTARSFAARPVTNGTASFASTYAALRAALPGTGAPLTVLDLACGDGHLLALLADASAAHTLIGVDLGRGELEAAWARLGERATLWRAKAQQLPLAAGSVDLITCHLALMLMDNADATRDSTPAQLWEGFGDMYDTDLPTPAALAGFRSDYLGALQPLCGPTGTVAYTDCYRLFIAKANP